MYSALVGTRVKRKEDPRLITGAAHYTADIVLPGMRCVAFLRSPYAHARLLGLDTATAASLPGVLAVVTGQDLREAYGPMPMDAAGEGTPAEDTPAGLMHSH